MPIITLTTDWGLRDHYAGAFKGALLSAIEGAQVIDISHQIDSFDYVQAAFVFRNAYYHFPNGTVHVISVNSQAEHNSELLAIKHKEHFFIGYNDGLFSLVFDEHPEQISLISKHEELTSDFKRNTFIKTAAKILAEGEIENTGSKLENIRQRMLVNAVIEDKTIKGTIIYVDKFGNAITNISKKLFEEHRRGRRFEIDARKNQYILTEISASYENVEQGNLLALFNTTGLLEIAINQGSASGLIGLSCSDGVRILFY